MLHILLTTIISYSTNLHYVNREYHNTFFYMSIPEASFEGLRSSDRMAYNWRTKFHTRNKHIYRHEVITDYCLPRNY